MVRGDRLLQRHNWTCAVTCISGQVAELFSGRRMAVDLRRAMGHTIVCVLVFHCALRITLSPLVVWKRTNVCGVVGLPFNATESGP